MSTETFFSEKQGPELCSSTGPEPNPYQSFIDQGLDQDFYFSVGNQRIEVLKLALDTVRISSLETEPGGYSNEVVKVFNKYINLIEGEE